MRPIDADNLILGLGEDHPFTKIIKDAPTIDLKLPETPIECAEMLINSAFEYETNAVQKAFGAGEKARMNYYSVEELRQIAEHLNIYCNYNEKEDI